MTTEGAGINENGQTVTFVQPMLSKVDTSRRVEIVRLDNAETTDI